MYSLDLNGDSTLRVRFRNHTMEFATDGNQPNPLEAAYATLAGCAGVYARKACKTLGIDAAGISIDCKPVIRLSGGRALPARFVTDVRFPQRISEEQRKAILDEIDRCAVKQLIHEGAGIEFVSRETVPEEVSP